MASKVSARTGMYDIEIKKRNMIKKKKHDIEWPPRCLPAQADECCFCVENFV